MSPSTVKTPAAEGSSRTLLTVALLTGAVASLVSAYIIFGLATTKTAYAVSMGRLAFAPVETFTIKTGLLSPITLADTQGQQHPIADIAQSADGTSYYLLFESDEPVISNLFSQLPNGTVTHLTNTDTLKYKLSYDSGSQMIAYQSAHVSSVIDTQEPKNSTIELFSLQTKKALTVATGTDPVLMKGSNTLLYKSNQEIKGYFIATKSLTPPILTVASAYAIDPTSGTIAAYNLDTKKIDIFTLLNGLNVSYQKSLESTQQPSLLAYLNSSLYTGASITENGMSFFKLTKVEGENSLSIPIERSSTMFNRIYTYGN